MSYPQQQGQYPPQQQGQYPQQPGQYPQQQGQYPPQTGQYPQQQGQYPPQSTQYPQQTAQYPPQSGQYPAQQQYGQAAYNPQQQYYSRQPAAVAPKKSKRNLFLIIGGCIALVAIGIVVISLLFGIFEGVENADYYKFGDDQVPSIKLVLGEVRSITGSESSASSGQFIRRYTYRIDSQIHGSDQVEDDLSRYTGHLMRYEGFYLTEERSASSTYRGGYRVSYAKESVEPGKIIILDIDYSTTAYTLVFTKTEGTLTIFR